MIRFLFSSLMVPMTLLAQETPVTLLTRVDRAVTYLSEIVKPAVHDGRNRVFIVLSGTCRHNGSECFRAPRQLTRTMISTRLAQRVSLPTTESLASEKTRTLVSEGHQANQRTVFILPSDVVLMSDSTTLTVQLELLVAECITCEALVTIENFEFPAKPSAAAASSTASRHGFQQVAYILPQDDGGAGASMSAMAAIAQDKPLNPQIDSLFPAIPNSPVFDQANMISNIPTILSKIKLVRDSNALSIAVATFRTIGQYDVTDVAREIGRKWRVALANDTLTATTRNTGAVIVLVADTHKCRVEVATGSEGYLTDATAAQLCRDQVANFRAGSFTTGIANMIDAIQARHIASMNPSHLSPSNSADTSWLPVFVWLTIFCVIIGSLGWFAKRKMDEQDAREEEAERLRIDAMWQIVHEDRRKEQARKQAQADETVRWNALTPAQQKAERRAKQEAALKAEEERKERQRREDERRASSSSSTTIISTTTYYESPSSTSTDYGSSSSSTDSGFSSGGSDSFSGGGGGSDW